MPHFIHVPKEDWMVPMLSLQSLDVTFPLQKMSSCSDPWKARPPLRRKRKKGGRKSQGAHRPTVRYPWCSLQAV